MSFVRIAAAAAIFTLLPAVGAMAKPVTLGVDTNLRKSPGTDGEVVTLMLKGATVDVDFDISADRFHYWSVEKKAYVIDAGTYDLQVGASSADIRQTCEITR